MTDALLRYLTFDIECLPDNGAMPDAQKSPVILISVAFNPARKGQTDLVLVGREIDCTRKDVIVCSSEMEMLQTFASIVRDYNPDVIAGYNSNGFDWPYIVDRARALRTDLRFGRDGGPCYYRQVVTNTTVSIVGRVVADLLPIIRSMAAQDKRFSLKQYTLRNVAKELLKIEKLDVDPKEIEELWNGDGIRRLISYSRRDAVLVMNLLTELKPMDKYIALAKASGSLLQDIVNGGQSGMIENLLLRRFQAAGRVVSPKPSSHNEDEEQQLKGAVVLDPVKGLVENVVILDFKSLYPTIMMAHNLCYSTVVVSEKPNDGLVYVSPVGGKFVKEEVCKGIVPQILEELLNERMTTKKLMKSATGAEQDALDAKQYAMKILLNSFYGYSGYSRARLYSLDVAGAVTSVGRENLMKTKDIIEKEMGYEVVAGDTDSCFVKINKELKLDEAKQIGIQIAKKVTSTLPKPMELIFEAVARRALFVSKKRYALWRFEETPTGWKDKIKVSGMETVRRDWCELTGKTLNRVLELILKEGKIDDAVVCVREAVKSVRDGSVPIEDITLTRKYTKSTGSYKNKQPHVQLVEKMKARGDHPPTIGDRIEFVIVAGKKRHGHNTELFVNRAEDPKYAKEHGLRIDTEYYVEKQIMPPVMRIFEAFGLTANEVIGEKKQKTLGEWT